LAGDNSRLRESLERLHAVFKDAPELGSLINPARETGHTLDTAQLHEVLPFLDQALAQETRDPAAAVFGAAATSTARAAQLLAREYHLVATNVPYLSRGKQGERLTAFA